jgi:tetratricopeptide (TPR) repeat protein
MLVAGGLILGPGKSTAQETEPATEPKKPEPTAEAIKAEASKEEPKKSEAEIALEEGQKAFFKQDFENALKHFKIAAEKGKDDPNYLYFLGNTYLKMGRKEEARKEFETLLTKKPNHINATVALADLLYMEQDWEQVAKLLKGIVEFKHNYHIYHHLADAQYFLGDLREARKSYEEAIKLNEASASDHYQLANIFLAQLKYSRAADEYNRALDLGKKEAIVHYKLGMAYFNMRNYLGKIEKRKYLKAKSGQVLDEFFLIEAVPGDTDFYYCAPKRSCVYHLRRAIDAGIDAPELRFAYANVFFHTRRHQNADTLYQALEKEINEENRALYYYYFGQVKFRQRDFGGYIAKVKKAIELDEKVYGHTLVEAYQAVAGHYGKMENLPKQIDFLKRCIDEEPSNATFHHSLGDAYLKQEDFSKAVDQWKLVLEINPDHPAQMTLMNLINRHQPDNGINAGVEKKVGDKKDQDKTEKNDKEKTAPHEIEEPGEPDAGKEDKKISGDQPEA